MLSAVLRSGRAVRMNIDIMRAFVRLRQMIEGNKDIAASPPVSRSWSEATTARRPSSRCSWKTSTGWPAR
jgi:hypothetical protein